jgi:TrmH family RNA methyltransferase
MMSEASLDYKHKKVQRLRKLVRKRDLRLAEGVFVIEGYKLLEEALGSGAFIEAVFTAPGADHPSIDQALQAGVRVHRLDDGVIERVADAVTPQPVMAVVRSSRWSMNVLADVTSVVVLVDVRDPGNAGTIMRSAEAAGIGAVVFCDGSVDVFNPKTVRSSAGAVFRLPCLQGVSPTEVLQYLRSEEFLIFGTAGSGETPYDEADFTRRSAIVLGNEAKGLRETVLGQMDQTVVIPIEGRSESLNVSMAAAVLCFEVARQRRLIRR